MRKPFPSTLSYSLLRNREKSCLSTSVSVLRKHLIVFNGGKPEAVGVGVVVAGSTAVTLDEWSAAEFLQAGTRRGQSLA